MWKRTQRTRSPERIRRSGSPFASWKPVAAAAAAGFLASTLPQVASAGGRIVRVPDTDYRQSGRDERDDHLRVYRSDRSAHRAAGEHERVLDSQRGASLTAFGRHDDHERRYESRRFEHGRRDAHLRRDGHQLRHDRRHLRRDRHHLRHDRHHLRHDHHGGHHGHLRHHRRDHGDVHADVTIHIGIPFTTSRGHHYAYYCPDHGHFDSAADLYLHIHRIHGIPRHRAPALITFHPALGFAFDL